MSPVTKHSTVYTENSVPVCLYDVECEMCRMSRYAMCKACDEIEAERVRVNDCKQTVTEIIKTNDSLF